MNLTRTIAAAALALATTGGALIAVPVQAQPGYYDGYDRYDRRYDRWDDRRWRDDRRRSWDYDRDGIPNRYDRRPYRYDGRGYRQRCWTEWRYDRWRGRYPVRYCR